MAPPSKKRKQQPAAGPNAKRSKGCKASAPRHCVEDASSLAWQTFGEDFGGLEVIEGVDVVREGSRVSFFVADTPAGKAAVAKDQEADGDDGEVFEGFGDDGDDDDNNQVNGDNNETDTVKETKKVQDAKKKTEKRTKKTAAPNAQDRKLEAQTSKKRKGGAHANPFGVLMNANDDYHDSGLNLKKWVALNLSPATVSAIGKLGFASPTAIQEQTIPHITGGADVIGKAQTGSGKTLAFGIPIVERWLELHQGTDDNDDDDDDDDDDGEEAEAKKERKGPTAVILSPTRELAKQIGDHIKALCDGLPTAAAPYVCVVTGGLSIQKQQRQLAKADIVIGTPGRLWEVLDGNMKLQEEFCRIRFLVVDEADRLFKAGQFKEAELIIGALDRRDPEAKEDDDDSGDEEDFFQEKEEEEEEEEEEEDGAPRQTLVFSATFDKGLQTKLAGKTRRSATGQGATDEEKMAYLMQCLKFRGQPKYIDANPVDQMAEGLREGLIECGAMEKDLYLYSVLLLNPGRRTLVFANSISAVRRVAPFLQNLDVPAQPLHSQMAQKARLRSLERFAATPGGVLVATDVAARGLDIHAVDLVVHYHVPRTADTYVHRSGRTARGARAGVSVLLCGPDEVLPTRRLAAKVHAKRQRQQSSSSSKSHNHIIETLPLDKKIVARLKPRADLSKKLADAVLAKEKAHSEDAWLRGAADELGVEYDEDEFETNNSGAGFRGGRGGGRKRKDKEAAALSKAEMGALRAQLRQELARRVNLGVSERYVAGGRVDMAKLIREKEKAATTVGGLFLGGDDSFGLGFGTTL
ncbi:DEAD-like helicase [Beauveria brongniartii RCEF 3172]|uniref:ATP-dependent RNA helicase n=1 Tax=Beauveria brongniartii RCEF 3172 TaxID=1081107 RepID=A0A166ZT68_9HYPO|nr:DEAD-like helicase [Beauveria brongniartii RCEF 3172]